MNVTHDAPYWWDGMPAAPEETVPPAMPARVDAAIVGAGITGLHAAIRLARAGRSVVVLEAGRLGAGASSRNNGMVVPYLRKTPSVLAKEFGQERAKEVTRAAISAFEFTKNFIIEENIDCDLSPNERILLAETDRQFLHLRELIEDFERAGVPTGFEPLVASRLTGLTGLTGYSGAIMTRTMPSLHPGKYCHALAQVARAAGVVLLPFTRATSIQGNAGRFTVETTRGPVTASNVAVATNGYSSELLPWVQRRVIPVAAYMLASEPVDPAVMASRFPVPRSFTSPRRDLVWVRSSPDGTRILFGGRTGRSEGGLQRKARLVRAEAAAVLPEIGSLEISHCWQGNMAFTFDGVPHVGQVGGIHYSLGYCGAGLAMGSWFGRLLGHRMLGEDAPIAGFDGAEFPSRFFYRRRAWFIPWLIRSMRIRDRWDTIRSLAKR